jgi:hypothetical protein
LAFFFFFSTSLATFFTLSLAAFFTDSIGLVTRPAFTLSSGLLKAGFGAVAAALLDFLSLAIAEGL